MAQLPPTPAVHPTDRLLGTSPAIAALRAQLRHLATFDTPGSAAVPTVLLQGETGTGKGLVARVLHESGPRAHGSFVEVNCAAIPEALLEAELFGFVAGAFTDAKRSKPGLFEVASGGTLFLDEIDALPLALQGKLLNAIEAKRVRSVGAVADHPVDIKLIAATPVDLGARIAAGSFRADLYYRLAVVVLAIPPLRARGEDVGLLAEHYLRWYAEAHRIRPKQLSRAAEAWLCGYAWPGNVRELSHLMERVTLLHPEDLVDAPALEQLCFSGAPPAPEVAAHPLEGHRAVEEPAQIRQALEQTRGNVAQAARLLGWSRKALRYRMRRYGIETPPRARGRPRRAARPDEGFDSAVPRDLPALPGIEQKPVAVLAVELTFAEPSTAGPAAYEPWTQARRWEQVIAEKVRGFGGTLVQRSPSLLLAAFGVPHVLEQLPQRAVQAALMLQHLATEGSEPAPVLRQAGHWGQMQVDMAAREPAQRLRPLKDTLALPVRLLGQAGPGDIVLSLALGRLVAGWCTLEEMPQVGAAPVGAYRVMGLVPRRSPLAGAEARTLSPFVGRARELTTLQTLLAEAEAGRGQAVGIVGEPGVGKSRLLLEFRRCLAGRRVTYLEGRCLPYGNATPYLSVLDLLRENCGIAAIDTPTQVAAKVRLGLQEVGLDPDERAPYLLHLLGLPSALDGLPGGSPETLKQRTAETLWQLSLQGSQRRPLILAVEDVQWVDPSSEVFFEELVERLASTPILFLATYRPGYRPRWLGQSYATQLSLPPLTTPDSRHVVDAVCQATSLPEPVTQAILARAEGNALFLEELTRAVLEQGQAEAAVAVPDTLQGVLLARIDRLPVEVKRALQLAAVVGRDCPLSLLETLWEGRAAALAAALARLVEAELLYQQGVPPRVGYRFKHALIQEAAYQALPGSHRQQTHQLMARVLEARVPEICEAQPELVAHHYTEAGLGAQAVPYWERAGRRAIQRSANTEAIAHLTKGLALLETLPGAPERMQQELVLQTDLGLALMAIKGYAAPEVEIAYARARQLCQQVGETSQLFPVLRGLWIFYVVRGELQTARELGEQILGLAQRQQDPALLVEAHRVMGTILFYLGEPAPALVHLEQGIELYDLQQHRSHAFIYGQDPALACLSFAAWALWFLGYPDRALKRSREAVALAQELAHPFSLVHTLVFAAAVHGYCREAQAVQERAEAAITLSAEQGFTFWVAMGNIRRGWALAERGHVEEAIALIRRSQAAYQSTGAEISRPSNLAMLAEAYGKGDQIKEGLNVLEEALAAAHKTQERYYEAELYRLHGEFLLRQSVAAAHQAETCFRQALDVARRQRAKSLELRAAMSLSRFWQQEGKREEARQLLAEIYSWFTEGFDSADLQEAKALLNSLSGRNASRDGKRGKFAQH